MENEDRRNYRVSISESAFEKYWRIQSDTLFEKVTRKLTQIGEYPDIGRIYIPDACPKGTGFEVRKCVCASLYLYYRVVDEANTVYLLDIRSQRQRPISPAELRSIDSGR